jgi:hypothetical protein
MAQGSEEYGSGMKVNISENGQKYIRFITWHQIWTRYTENNSGTSNISGELTNNSFDVGIRRSRFLAYSQINKRFLVLTHWGINNQTFNNGGGSGSAGIGGYGQGKKPQIFIHDAWTEFAVFQAQNKEGKKRWFTLDIGAGLHYINGLSRKSMASTLNFMTVDAPIFNWQNIEFTDQFARQFGWFARGKAGKLEYRLAFNKPFSADLSASIVNDKRAFNVATDNTATMAYFSYNFLDQESTLLPFYVNTYLGTKKVFNVGFGFYNHPKASGVKNMSTGKIDKQDQRAFSVDVFYDRPLGENGSALTLYAAYYNFDYGTNYFRTVGIMNTNTLFANDSILIANDLEPKLKNIEGAGNARVLFGTGSITYAEVGYLLPKKFLGEDNGKLQLFGAYTYKNLQYLNTPGHYYDVGVNYLIAGHHAKITLQYSSRALFTTDINSGDRNATSRRGEFILQTHIFL